MENSEALDLIAELALGLAGFSGVVVALGSSPASWMKVDRLRLAALLAASLGALFLALGAIFFINLGIGLDQSYRISSALMAIHGAAILLTIVPKAWRITRNTTGLTSTYSVAVFIPAVVLLSANTVIQAASVMPDQNSNRFGIFLGGLVALLLIGTVQFVRLLFVRRDDR